MNFKIFIYIVFYFFNIVGVLPSNVIKAISDKNFNEYENYLTNSGDINAQSEQLKFSSLHFAIIYGAKSIAKDLIQKGANLDIQNDLGETPLMLACKEHQLDVLTEILLKKPNLEIKNNRGRTALHVAAHCGFFEGVKILTQVGSYIYALDENEKKPIQLADDFLKKSKKDLRPEQISNYEKIIIFLYQQELIDQKLKDVVPALPEELLTLIRLEMI